MVETPIPPSGKSPSLHTNTANMNLARILSEPENLDETIRLIEDELLARRNLDLTSLSAEDQFEILKSKGMVLLPEDEILKRLKESKANGKSLKIKFGIDPTGADVHLGHTVPMMMLNRLQRMGHKIIVIIGNFTAKIGDPTGKVASRPPLSDETINKNLSTYAAQIKPIFDTSKAEIVLNSSWLDNVDLRSLVQIFAKVSVSEILQREDFRNRLTQGSGLTMLEMLYPIMMALDSVKLKENPDLGCDIEIGGNDQLLNMQVGRDLMGSLGQLPQCMISVPLLEGTTGDGNKMSKSLGNYVALTEPAEEIYGKIMSIPDHLMRMYFHCLTEILESEWTTLEGYMNNGIINPVKIKKMLARVVVSILYDQQTALSEQEKFDLKFSKRDYSALDNVPEIEVENRSSLLVDILVSNGMASSKGELRRLIQGGGLKLVNPTDNTESKITDIYASFENIAPGSLLKIGKMKIVKVKLT